MRQATDRSFAIAARLVAATALFALLTAASPASARDRPLTVVTTIAQIGEPLRTIAGDRAEVKSLLGEGVDPHLYRPTRSDVAMLAAAEVVFWSGLNLEAQMKDTLGRLAATRPVVAIAERLPPSALLATPGAPHDPHVWMDPDLWRQALAAAVYTLVAADPAGGEGYRARAQAYFVRLTELDAYIRTVIASIPAGARTVVTAHDAFNYFGARYGLDVIGIQGISTEGEAGLAAVEGLVALLVERRIPAVFVETSVPERHVRALIEGAAARGHTVVIGGALYSDAMGAPGSWEGTYIGMLDHNATILARALGGTAPAGGLAGRLAAPIQQGGRP
ncbi:MAG: manganese transporter [Alphaproteobacteria bacterium]|nr:manganese transporter [Alphaproteobacteria bacterium]